MLDPVVTNKQLKCLNSWPEGSLGYQRDQRLIAALNDLCVQYGYGLVPYLAARIEEISRKGDEAVDFFQRQRNARMEFLKDNWPDGTPKE